MLLTSKDATKMFLQFSFVLFLCFSETFSGENDAADASVAFFPESFEIISSFKKVSMKINNHLALVLI